MFIKLFCVIFLFITSTCVNAVIIDGNFSARVYYDGSDEGIWSKNLRDSEVTGTFWYDTALAPAPDPRNPNYTSYLSDTNSWVNIIYFIDGKTIDISKSVGSKSESTESVNINADTDEFEVYDKITLGDPLGDYELTIGSLWAYKTADIIHDADIIQDNGLEQNFSWASDDSYIGTALFVRNGVKNGQAYVSELEMALTDISVMPREVSVPEPSTFLLLVIGLGVLVFRRRAFA
ncbi:MAG: PEP-CTERM sorting domain-containing protein [Pseudomonadota bacterium]